ncbi:MBL fold metallo-hydrolase [Pelagovum pacificum]|uniref:MBL fold metallo-hydrolase n=1 Tax=Pelagovum pacificum TaxID=2588711 RepID=A0A5C5G8Y5_9RHOB|nr:MBL fold metallo-hydrolase [Pelagovum pacificum]QQA42093.1 MBL fold metallo-hydrolase [Pelagovum pacificum]TNY31181.1 MBL fold metallo-hydrolase [Pelagovum pacificum]
MKLLFANSAHVHASERLLLKGGRGRRMALRVRYGLVRHPDHGAILIDTGYTKAATSAPGRSLLLRLYGKLLKPTLLTDGQPDAFLARQGLTPQDISTVVLTHFHADHVSGLSLFPQATLITPGAALKALRNRGTLANLRHGVFAELIPDMTTQPIEDRPLVRTGADLPPAHDVFGDGSLLALDLPGHAEGHVGLLFPKLETPLLYATDAAWLLDALDPGKAQGRLAALISDDRPAAAASEDVIRRFRAKGWQVMLCHDPAPTAYDEAGH